MMRCLSLCVIAVALLLVSGSVQARSASPEQQLSLSTDSLTWALGGYSVIGTYESRSLHGLRFHLEAFGIELPASIIDRYPPNSGEGWQRRVDLAVMLSVDHHPFEGLKGLHWGAGFNVQRSTVSRMGRSQIEDYATFEPILRLGYQWFPLSRTGLFITPYAALGFPLHLNEPEAIDGEVYGEAAILPVASLQIGWRFPRPAHGEPGTQ